MLLRIPSIYKFAFENRILAKPNLQLEDDNTPLHISAFFGHYDLLQVLLDENVELIDQLNRYGWSPLMQACHEGHHD